MLAIRFPPRALPALAGLCAVLGALPDAAVASDAAFPERAVKIIAPQQPGSATDKVARTVAAALERDLGTPVVVENRPGAGGSIGADHVAKAAPDGHTLLLGGYSNLVVTPASRNDVGYDAARDFIPLSRVAIVPFVYAVHPSVPATSLPELVALAREKPDTLNVATLPGGVTTMGLAEFFAATGVKMHAIEYKGTVTGITDLVAGRIDFMFNEIGGLLAMANAGRVRLLAVVTPARVAAAPELPTAVEQGLPAITMDVWYGVVAPAGLPPAVLARLEQAMTAVRDSTDFQAQVRSLGYEPVARDDTASFAQRIADDAREARRMLAKPGAR